MTRLHLLDTVRVIEFTTAWAGPAVGRFLGAMGADVIKIESAQRYDIWRGVANRGANAAPPGTRPYNSAPNFNGLNRNKRGVSLELTGPAGKEVFFRLLDAADVVISNFSARVLPNLGLTYELLAASKPDLILLEMPSLGASGPYAALPGYGSIIEGMGGLAARFGYLDEGARVSQTFYPDCVAGVHGALAVLAALQQRRTTGRGIRIDLSQQEAMWMQLGEGLVSQSFFEHEPQRMGNREPNCSPAGVFQTSDGHWVALVVANDEQFARLVKAAAPTLDTVARLTTNQRIAQRSELESLIGRWSEGMSLDSLLTASQSHGIGMAQVLNYQEAARSEPLNRIGMFEDVDHAEVGIRPYLRIPLSFDGETVDTQRPGVCFGAQTDEVLQEWASFTKEEIAHLREIRVVIDEIAPIQ